MGAPHVTEQQFDMIKLMLKGAERGDKQKIADAMRLSIDTIRRIDRRESFDEPAHKPKKGKEVISTEQDIHDIAREVKNIRSILQKMAEDLGVKI